MTERSIEERLETLETTIAYQDQAIEELNAALEDQFRQIEALKRHLARLGDQMADISAHPALTPDREPPPPHY